MSADLLAFPEPMQAEEWQYAIALIDGRLDALIETGSLPDVEHPAIVGAVPLLCLPTTVVELAQSANLEPLDTAILTLAVLHSIDPSVGAKLLAFNTDPSARGLQVGPALRVCGTSLLDPLARERMRPDAPLRAFGLLDLGPATRLLGEQVLVVPERVVTGLLGSSLPDPMLLGAMPTITRDPLPRDLLEPIPAVSGFPVILRGRAGTAAVDRARRIAMDVTGVDAIVIDLARLRLDDVEEFARACAREAALSATMLVLDARSLDADAPVTPLLTSLIEVGTPVVVLVDARRALGPWERRIVTLDLPTVAQREQWWAFLAPAADASLARTASHLDPDDIADSGNESAALHRVAGQTRRSRVQTVKPAIGLADVILDDRPAAMLRALCDRVRYRSTVLDDWGMRPGGARGRGVTALFAGPAGTGKTMSAEAIAGELGVPLFVVDLASVVDKYIGETEKNLEDVFRTVENEDGVLLFDEADALFGKRSDVSDARDRYANIEVAYLLQRIEAFDGLAILTTNLRANLDEAFQRRLDMIVDFPEPGPDARRDIWLHALGPFPDALTDADAQALATLDLTGGYIRAATITAAYLAAASGTPLDRTHILNGLREEWRKAGRLNFPDHTFHTWHTPTHPQD